MQGAIPMLYKKNYYRDPLDWEVWHFNAAIPVQMQDTNTNEVMLTVTLHEFWTAMAFVHALRILVSQTLLCT